MERSGGWLHTFTGKRFYPLDPRPEEICIEDIAHSLSQQGRFAGHSNVFYSVAEHCVRASFAVPDIRDARWALLHDASEAYLVDVPTPLKRLPEFAAYREAETALMIVICERFGLSVAEPPSVKEADARMLLTEKRDLMSPAPAPWGREDILPYDQKIVPWTAVDAERRFLSRFQELP